MASNKSYKSAWFNSDTTDDIRTVMTLMKKGDILEIESTCYPDGLTYVIVTEACQKGLLLMPLLNCTGNYEIKEVDIPTLWEKRKLRINNKRDHTQSPYKSDSQLSHRIDVSHEIYKNACLYGVSTDRFQEQFVIWIRNSQWDQETPEDPVLRSGRVSALSLKPEGIEAENKFLKQLLLGDIIEFNRRSFKHLAIYVGSGFVVHLVNTGSSSAISGSRSMGGSMKGGIITIQKLFNEDVWIAGQTARCNNQHDNQKQPFSWHQILSTAIDEIMTTENSIYCALTNNCEHWVMRVRYGRARSEQVQNVLIGGGITAIAAIAATSIFALFVNRNKKQK